MEDNSADKLALEMARNLVLDAFPLWQVGGHDQNGDPMSVRGPFWGKVMFDDEEATKARIEEMAKFIGVVARRLRGK